jgi:hypothetical protein
MDSRAVVDDGVRASALTCVDTGAGASTVRAFSGLALTSLRAFLLLTRWCWALPDWMATTRILLPVCERLKGVFRVCACCFAAWNNGLSCTCRLLASQFECYMTWTARTSNSSPNQPPVWQNSVLHWVWAWRGQQRRACKQPSNRVLLLSGLRLRAQRQSRPGHAYGDN